VPEIEASILDPTPLKRLGEPREVALLVVYLASEAADFLTGQTMYLDGGRLAGG
jgi:NAD(P)-dependent dehydrogenase (short-subunit alcohol dehydrogenase family)